MNYLITIHVMVFTPPRWKKYICQRESQIQNNSVWKTTSWKAQFEFNWVIKHWIRALHISDWRMALCSLMCRFFPSLFYGIDFHVITLLEHLIEMIIVCNLMCCKLDGKKVKVKHSLYRPGVAQRVLRKLRFPDFMTTAQDGSKVVSLMHHQPLPPGNTPGTHFF